MPEQLRFDRLDRTWVIAEIGINHEGDAARAREMISLAAKAGADAVKFQTFQIDNYISTTQPERKEKVGRFELSRAAFKSLAEHAVSCGVVFFSTPLHENDVDFLAELAPLIKISSGDLTHLRLIRHAAGKGLPMIISTGLGEEDEIAAAVAAAEEGAPGIGAAGKLMLFHCIAAYPADEADANLRNIAWLKDCFGLPTGYSDHTLGGKACELAVAAGAVALEKHFTYRREGQTFHDHALSAEPHELADLIAAVRRVELLLGSYTRNPSERERSFTGHLRRSVAVKRAVAAGQPVPEDALILLRPGWGLPPERMGAVAGRRTTRDLAVGEIVREEDLAD